MKKVFYKINRNDSVKFNNHVSYCVGTGRMGLALQKTYLEQLKLVQDEIGFAYIRGHGLFCDDMAIYNEYEEDGKTYVEYNFTYLDTVIDSYLELNIRPFLELGFMPSKLASGKQTVFYWKGNVTPPKDYDIWADLVKSTLRHLIDRYGEYEVTRWPIEVWNEPNLPGFWKDADMKEYMKLYSVTVKAVKEVNENFHVGGPAICGVEPEKWFRGFFDYCKENNTPVDFATRHAYSAKPPKLNGRYVYHQMCDVSEVFDELKVSRDIIDGYDEFRGIDMHITEFNTSYDPTCPVHDTNYNAAYIARLLCDLGETSASYSYWTFGDVFEEKGVPFTPFHGGFGLVANGLIPKPTFWTFAFFSKLKDEAIFKSEDMLIVRDKKDIIKGVAFNLCEDVYYDLDDNSKDEEKDEAFENLYNIDIELDGDDGKYVLITKTVDEEVCNPLKAWCDIGSPKNPTDCQNQLIRDCAYPYIETRQIECSDGKMNFSLLLRKNAVKYFEIRKVEVSCDRGYTVKYN